MYLLQRLKLRVSLLLSLLLAGAVHAQNAPFPNYLRISDPKGVMSNGEPQVIEFTNSTEFKAVALPAATGNRVYVIQVFALIPPNDRLGWGLQFNTAEIENTDITNGIHTINHERPSKEAHILFDNRTTCGAAPNGAFQISELQFDMDTSKVRREATLKQVKATFKLQCTVGTLAGEVDGELSYSSANVPTPVDETPDGSPAPAPIPVIPPDIAVTLPTDLFDHMPELRNTGATSALFHITSLDDYEGDVEVMAWSDPEGLDVTVTPGFLPAPGNGEVKLDVKVPENAMPRNYIVNVVATTNGRTYPGSFIVNVPCEVPTILGAEQPQSGSASRGATATLQAKASGSGPFKYQWYSGHTGMTFTPMANGTSATFTTPKLNETSTYWVRISNACGSVDSQPATLFVQ